MNLWRTAALVLLHNALALAIGIALLAAVEALFDFGTVDQTLARLAHTGGTYVYALASDRGRVYAICISAAMLTLPTVVALRAARRGRRGRVDAGPVALDALVLVPVVTVGYLAAVAMAPGPQAYISVQGSLALTFYEAAFVVWELIYVPVSLIAHGVARATGVLRAGPPLTASV